jgi:hypothetical protein
MIPLRLILSRAFIKFSLKEANIAYLLFHSDKYSDEYNALQNTSKQNNNIILNHLITSYSSK